MHTMIKSEAILFLVMAIAIAASPMSLEQTYAAGFRAGAAIADITPQELPVSMTGSFQDRIGERLQWLSSNAAATRVGRLRDLAFRLELS